MSGYDIIGDESTNGGGDELTPFMLEDGGLPLLGSDLFVTDEPQGPPIETSGEYYPPNSFTDYENSYEMEGQSVPIWCICRQPEGDFMIGCEQCNEWYHVKCIGLDRETASHLEHFTCHVCDNVSIPDKVAEINAQLNEKKRAKKAVVTIDDEDGRKPVKEAINIKRSAAAPVVASRSAPPKKRAREDLTTSSSSSASGSTHAKKPKLNDSRTLPVDKTRQDTRARTTEALQTSTTTPQYKAAIAQAEKNTNLKYSVETPPYDVLVQIAAEIEVAIYDKCGRKTNEDYREEYKRIKTALLKNVSLGARLVLRSLTPVALSRMTAAELAPEKERAALTAIQAEDEALRNKAAETSVEAKHQNKMFHIRGKTDDRIIPTLPAYQPPATDDDDSMKTKTDENSSETTLSSLADSGLLLNASILNSSNPINTKVVDLDLDSFDVTKVKVQSLATVNPEPGSLHSPPLVPLSLKKNDSDMQSGIRSILKEIAMDSGEGDANEGEAEHNSASNGASSHDAVLEYNPNDPFAHDPAEQADRARPLQASNAASRIHPDERIWRGSLSYPGACPEVKVELINVSGPKIESVLHRLQVTNFEITQRVDLAKIMAYFPQLDNSASRVCSLLYFNPILGDYESERRYEEMFAHLHSIARAGVVPLAAALAADAFKELYVLPIKANDFTYAPSVIPINCISSFQDRLYFCVISDKKKLEKSHLDWRASSTSRLSAPAPLSSTSGLLGSGDLGSGAGPLGGVMPRPLGGALGRPLLSAAPSSVSPLPLASAMPFPSATAPPMLGRQNRPPLGGSAPVLGGPPLPRPLGGAFGAPVGGPPPQYGGALGGHPQVPGAGHRAMYSMPPSGVPAGRPHQPPPSYGRPDPYGQPPHGWDHRGPPPQHYPGPAPPYGGGMYGAPPPLLSAHSPPHRPAHMAHPPAPGPGSMPPLSSAPPVSFDQATAALDSLVGMDLDKLLGPKP